MQSKAFVVRFLNLALKAGAHRDPDDESRLGTAFHDTWTTQDSVSERQRIRQTINQA